MLLVNSNCACTMYQWSIYTLFMWNVWISLYAGFYWLSLSLSLSLPSLSLSLSLSSSLSLPPPPSLSLQFHIPNPTTANYVRTVQLPLNVTSLENVTRMVASDDGDYIFAMTPSRVSAWFMHSPVMHNGIFVTATLHTYIMYVCMYVCMYLGWQSHGLTLNCEMVLILLW